MTVFKSSAAENFCIGVRRRFGLRPQTVPGGQVRPEPPSTGPATWPSGLRDYDKARFVLPGQARRIPGLRDTRDAWPIDAKL